MANKKYSPDVIADIERIVNNDFFRKYNNYPKLCKVAQAADLLGVTDGKIQTLCAEGVLESIKYGNALWINILSVCAYAKANNTQYQPYVYCTRDPYRYRIGMKENA